jgi:hypothetical protein
MEGLISGWRIDSSKKYLRNTVRIRLRRNTVRNIRAGHFVKDDSDSVAAAIALEEEKGSEKSSNHADERTERERKARGVITYEQNK